MNELVYIKNATTLKLDKNTCNACGMCVKVCPHAVFKIENGTAQVVRRDYCMECGACALNCPQAAISLISGLGCGCATGIVNNFFTKDKKACGCSNC